MFSSLFPSLWLILLAFTLLLPVHRLLRIGRRYANMPPGPPIKSIVGNEHLIPKSNAHLTFTEWARKYGGIYTLKRFDNTVFVVSDPNVVKELFDKKSSLYSHRPAARVGELITHGNHLLLMQYGDEWRAIRKLVHQYFMEAMCEKQHFSVQNAEAIQLMNDFLVAPEYLMKHPKRYSNSITNSLVYGIRTKDIHSDYMNRLYTIMHKFSEILEFGATPPINSFPLLKLVPESFLGHWKSRAVHVGELMNSLYGEVFSRVKRRRDGGENRRTFMDLMLDLNEKSNSISPEKVMFTGGVLMEGGSDTSSTLILGMLRAMIDYPEVQKRAQTEIDAVIGEDRSPTWADFSKLPYINMMIKEGHRWRPVTPLGIPHAVAEDDWFRDMFIPKGSTVILNMWGLHHDPTRWDSPAEFKPERFAAYPKPASQYLNDGPARDHFGYGAGRRVCPGVHVAERNLFVAMAKLLWAFEFRKTAGAKEAETSTGMVQAVRDFECEVTVRSEKRAETIRREFEEAQEVFADYDD